jgi:hypothetical protein
VNLEEKSILGVILFLGFSLRFYFFLDSGFWADEGQHIWIAVSKTWFTMRDTYATTAHDQPFGMYPILRAWSSLFGTSPFSFRTFSVMVSGCSIGTTALAAHWIFRNTKATLAAAALMAVSPFAVRYGYDVTPYCLVNFLAPLSIGLTVKNLRDENGISDLRLIFVNLLLLNVHYFSYFLVASEIAVWLWFWKGAWKTKGVRFLTIAGVYAIGSLPILLLFDPTAAKANHSWISIDRRGPVDIVLHLLAYSRWAQGISVALIGLLLWLTYVKKKGEEKVTALWTLVVLSVAFAYVSGWLFWNILGHERYLMIAFPALVLALAGMAAQRWKVGVFALAAWISVSLAGIALNQPAETRQDFEKAGRWISDRSRAPDGQNVLLTPQCCNWSLYYYLTLDRSFMQRWKLKTHPDLLFSNPELMKASVQALGIPADHKMFLVLFYEALGKEAQYRKALEPYFELEDEKHFTGVSVAMYKPRQTFAKKTSN